jgi:hypothetical protein
VFTTRDIVLTLLFFVIVIVRLAYSNYITELRVYLSSHYVEHWRDVVLGGRSWFKDSYFKVIFLFIHDPRVDDTHDTVLISLRNRVRYLFYILYPLILTMGILLFVP